MARRVIGIYNDRQTVIDDGVSKRLVLKKGPNVIRAAIVNAGVGEDVYVVACLAPFQNGQRFAWR